MRADSTLIVVLALSGGGTAGNMPQRPCQQASIAGKYKYS